MFLQVGLQVCLCAQLYLNYNIVCQVSTFAINYRGHPFMESLTENRSLLYSLAGAGGFVVMLALGEYMSRTLRGARFICNVHTIAVLRLAARVFRAVLRC